MGKRRKTAVFQTGIDFHHMAAPRRVGRGFRESVEPEASVMKND